MKLNFKYNNGQIVQCHELAGSGRLRFSTPVLMYFISLLLLGASGCSDRFRHSVQQVPKPASVSAIVPDYTDSTITVAAGKHYGRSWLHTFFYGKHYRDVWTTPVQVDVLDIGKAKGGLRPIEMGGSRQTINLRLKDPQGTEYVLRSLDKEPASILSEKLQQSYLANIVRDATSATNPYGALTIPPMAAALHIYHTDPELVFIPHDPRLGDFMNKIGGTLALLERRPDGDQSNNALMGNSPNVESTQSALTERLTDNDTRFDARFYLRARMLDMLIGDWSRHEDNWRWAEFEHDGKGSTYKAIPRDRDNVYYKLEDAPIPWLFMRLGLKPHFQTFRKNLKNIEKLNRSGRNLDELILAELELSDWIEIADSVQAALTDQVLAEAVHAMPEPIYQLTGPDILTKLKSRRAQLPEAARQYFNVLAKEAQLVGTDKYELFEVEALTPGKVQVKMFKMTKEGEVKKLLFERVFDASTTKEIKIYGLGGEDRFVLKGHAKPNIKISIWGGAGDDVYESLADFGEFGKRVHIVDSKYRNVYHVNKNVSVDIDDNLLAKDFNAEGWLLRYYLD
ncbi:hypothetical protein ACSX1A_00440 [Pontibacter sp. MBLB2868]|uniref:hypothetical protein n=1 Tax=Pontibacter sp. MBLB2868 TaxID=3451555 RepID=UPI003F7552F9